MRFEKRISLSEKKPPLIKNLAHDRERFTLAMVKDLEQRIENLTAKKKLPNWKKNRQIRDGGIHAQELC